MNASGKHRAMVVGNADTRRQAIEILEALDAGVPLSEMEIPAGITIGPHRAEVEACCQELGIKHKRPLPHGGWESKVFMMAQPWYDANVSMVQSGTETSPRTVRLQAIFEGIRNGKWKGRVGRVKAKYASALEAAKKQGDPKPEVTAKNAVRSLKAGLPGVLWSGVFSYRANEHITAHSGLLCLDLDHFQNGSELKAELANDSYVQAFFVSPTGSGLKVLLRIEPDKASHERSFAAAEKYFLERYHVQIDNCKDVARLCFVSHDENIFIRAEEAALLSPLPPEPKPEAAPPPPPPARDIDAELTAKCGPAFYTKKGAVVLNQSYFVQRICRENLVIFEQDENRFYRYNAATGAWEAVVPGVIKELVRTEWERLTRLFNEPALAFKANEALLFALVRGIESHAGRTKVFARLKRTIHCANGMLKISADGKWDIFPFSPAYYARNPIRIARMGTGGRLHEARRLARVRPPRCRPRC